MAFLNEGHARAFHEAYERLAPRFGMEIPESVVEWEAESLGGQLLLAVMDEIVPGIEESGVRKFIERLAEIDLNSGGKPRHWSVERDVFYEMFKKAL